VRAVLWAVLRVMKPKLLATFAGIVGFSIIIVGYLFNWIF